MSGSIALAPSASLPQEPIRLPEKDVIWGILHDIIEPDGEDFVLACLQERMVEVPKSLAPELWALVGQKVIIGHFDGKHRVGRSSL